MAVELVGSGRNDTLSSHQCARPDTAGNEPWRCPDCSMLWESLPSAPVAPSKPKRVINKGGVAVLVGSGVGAYVGALMLLPPAVLTIGAVSVRLPGLIVSTWEERMSQRAKARMVIAEAEEITRQALEPEPEPLRCLVCGQPPDGTLVFIGEGGPWCFDHSPNVLVWDEQAQAFVGPEQQSE
ncbi:hypothetical protein ACIBHX_01880 [Nonomuraea sp. NPDC050536]|uniref:hypothetical protein n=1 Tax=Nonomuraea sp. NPDC050536 TaxID=3364366 RepID=UPI0037CB6186